MNDELQQFVQETLRQIQAGSAGHTNVGEVDFEVAIAKTKTAEGKIGIAVLEIGGNAKGEIKNEQVSKVRFSVRLKGASHRMAPLNLNR